MKSGKMMRIVSEFEELNKAVRAPSDANGCTARSIHVAADGRVALAPWLNSKHVVSIEYLMVRCAVERGSGAQ